MGKMWKNQKFFFASFFHVEKSYNHPRVNDMNESVTELANIWGLALANIEKELNNKIVFDSFFTDTKIAKAEGNVMTIVASSSLAVSMFKNQFLKTIKNAINRVTGTEYNLEFKTKEEFESSKPSSEEVPRFFPKARLDPRFSFDNFVVGSSDIEARQAAVLIASNPGKTFNPLLIYGDSGLGKTHLLEAIGNEIREQFPNLKVLYVSADYFLEESIKYMTSYNADQTFTAYFRDEVDVLLLDDIQYLKGRTKTLGVFFTVFQALSNEKKQIVLTSDVHPSTIDGLDERLKTRFEQGLAVQIKKPDIETSKKILRAKIEASDLKNTQIDDDVIGLLAEKFSDNVRELEGALNRLLFYTINFKPTQKIDVAFASEAVAGLNSAKADRSKLSPNRVISVVAEYHNLAPSQLTGKIRTAQVALARHLAMYLCKDVLGMNYSEIGKKFGKDHTSVMNGIGKVEKLSKENPDVIKVLKELKKKLGYE